MIMFSSFMSTFGQLISIMSVYRVYSLLILHLALQKTFHYSVEGEYLALSYDGDYATLLSQHIMLTFVFTRGHMCQFDRALYPTENVSNCLYVLFINDTVLIKRKP